MKKKLLLVILIISVVLAVALVGCAQSSDKNYGYDNSSNESKGEIENVSESGETTAERKIIYTAEVNIKSSDVKGVQKTVTDMLNSDEWIEKSTVADGYATLTVRIKTERLNSFLASLEENCEVTSKELSSTDVSLNYYDNVTKKTTLETEQARLLVLLEKAESISDIMQINKRLSEIESQLKQIEGKLNNYDSLIEYSQVTVSIRTPYEIQKDTFGAKLSRSFKNGLNFAENLFIFVLTALPFVIVIGGIVVLIIFLVKKNKRKNGTPNEKKGKKKDKKKDEKVVTLSTDSVEVEQKTETESEEQENNNEETKI